VKLLPIFIGILLMMFGYLLSVPTIGAFTIPILWWAFTTPVPNPLYIWAVFAIPLELLGGIIILYGLVK